MQTATSAATCGDPPCEGSSGLSGGSATGCTTECEGSSSGGPASASGAPSTTATSTTGDDSTGSDATQTSSSDSGSGSDDPTDPPGASTMCGDWECQGSEDVASCPFDCVPYEIAEQGQGQGKVCERTHMGFVPITEIGSGLYLGAAQGGLYPGGSNERPASHTAAGLEAAQRVVPVDGQVCLISIGMSNTGMKWNRFMQNGFPSIEGRNPAVVVANGAVGSNPVDTTADPSHGVWNTIDSQLADSGCTPDQVRVAWVLHAERGPSEDFMTEAARFEADLRATLVNMNDHFANLEMVYLSSRSYAGYGDKNNNPEPYAHQTAFVVKWVIEAQIEGTDPELSLDAGMPWLSWGPYLWADGLGADDQLGGIPGRVIPDDGMEYECSDFSDSDGIHPGQGMLIKASDQLVEFFSTDETAAAWLLQ